VIMFFLYFNPITKIYRCKKNQLHTEFQLVLGICIPEGCLKEVVLPIVE
jgi:phosphate starvation-inducible membrane PsiE